MFATTPRLLVPDAGQEGSLALPNGDTHRSTGKFSLAPGESMQEKVKIFGIEDHDDLIRLTRTFLNKMGFVDPQTFYVDGKSGQLGVCEIDSGGRPSIKPTGISTEYFAILEMLTGKIKETLEHPIQNVPICVFDFDLPGFTGADLTRDLTKAFPGLRVIIWTGDETNNTEPSMDAGARAVLNKPCSITTLENKIKETIFAP